MNDELFNSNNHNITKKAVRKWAADWGKRFKDLRRQVEKAGDDFDVVIKDLDVNAPNWRLFRNAARKLKRETGTPARYAKGVLRLIDAEIKHYGKIADGLTPKKD